MIESHDYATSLIAGTKRMAELSTEDGHHPPIAVASPPEFGGPEHVWTPEHLFVAAVSSCLMTTFHALVGSTRIEVLSYSDEAYGRLERGSDGLYSIPLVVLRPHVVVADQRDVDRVLRLLDKAESVCLIARSMSSVVEMIPEVSVAEPVPG